MPLVKGGNQERTGDSQTSGDEASALLNFGREGAKPEIAKNAVAEEMARFPQDGMETIEAGGIELSKHPDHHIFQEWRSVRRRSEENSPAIRNA